MNSIQTWPIIFVDDEKLEIKLINYIRESNLKKTLEKKKDGMKLTTYNLIRLNVKFCI